MLHNLDADYDLAKEARAKRKERIAKNERQHTQNLAKAGAGTGARKRDIDRTLAMTRASTASMGKFDRVLDGEKKLREVKRKVSVPTCHLTSPPLSTPTHSLLSPQFDPIEKPVDAERSANMALIKHIGNGGSSAKKAKREAAGDGAGDVVNVRKAMRFASGGQGAAALARKSGSDDKQKRKGKR